jgi:DNA-binding CsgD family transcriptional regulator
MNGKYREALDPIDNAVREMERFNLDFARPHILINTANASIGLRQYGKAEEAVARIERLAAESDADAYLTANAQTIRARLRLQQHSAHAAVSVPRAKWPRETSRSLESEFLATQALALGTLGRIDQAVELLERAEKLSQQLEPRLLCAWARAVCALGRYDESGQASVLSAYDETVSAGAFDFAVFAYRVNPAVLSVLARDEERRAELGELMVEIGDSNVASRHGLAPARYPSSPTRLTRREQQVYELLAEGKTNREIAAALFISEPTVKVHVRHLLRKLGVRTRTEAAVRCLQADTQVAPDAKRPAQPSPARDPSPD